MSYDAIAAERLRRALAAFPDVVALRMMGGLCFMLGGHMCCGVSKERLMVRVGAAGMAAALAEPHVRPMEMAGRRMGGFVWVAPEGFASDAALAGWVQRGVDFVGTLPAKVRQRRL